MVETESQFEQRILQLSYNLEDFQQNISPPTTDNLRYHRLMTAHVVKDYINKAKTDMFLPLSES